MVILLPTKAEESIKEYFKAGTVIFSQSSKKNEEYSKFLEDLAQCRRCFLEDCELKIVLPGTGNLDSEIVFVGEAPSLRRTYHLTFGEQSKAVFETILKAMGLRREKVWATNVVKCIIPFKRTGLPSQCQAHLKRELEILKPRFVIALGKTAKESLLKIKPRCAVFCMKHPMYYVYNPTRIDEAISSATAIADKIFKQNLFFFGESSVRNSS